MSTPLVPLPVPAGPAALGILPHLQAALDGTGPAVAPHPAGAPPPELAGNGMAPGTAVVVGTSGSTGLPKQAMLTADALHASADATHERLGGPGQWLLAMPAHHIAGLQLLLRCLRAGTGPVVADQRDGFGSESFARAVDRLDAGALRYCSLVPAQLVTLMAHPRGLEALRRLDAVLVGGAASPPALLDRARAAGVAVVTTYGMSETSGGCVYDGRPLAGTGIRLDSDGRISLGGTTVACGYLGHPDLSAASFRTDPDGTRWFRTDDLGDLDDTGRLRVHGRVDDLINSGGLKVAPRLVEEALLAHVPGVAEAVVVGTDHPQWGQAVSAALVLSPTAGAPTVGGVRRRLRGILPDHALPHRLVVLDALPLRGPGKPDRGAVRAAFTASG